MAGIIEYEVETNKYMGWRIISRLSDEWMPQWSPCQSHSYHKADTPSGRSCYLPYQCYLPVHFFLRQMCLLGGAVHILA